MTGIEVLSDLLEKFVKDLREEIGGQSAEVFAWQPDPGANSIGLTAWHVIRWMDVLGTRILDDLPAEAEQWHVQGWADRTGYNPAGIGYAGLGTVTGYTLEEAADVPALSAEELLSYLSQAHGVVREQLTRMSDEELTQPIRGTALKGTTYGWLKVLTGGFFGHIGEIQALKAMRERITRTIQS